MAPRRSPSSSSTRQGSFAPSNDVASFKDLLLFEERLKQNAALLRSRKRKYEGESYRLTTSIEVFEIVGRRREAQKGQEGLMTFLSLSLSPPPSFSYSLPRHPPRHHCSLDTQILPQTITGEFNKSKSTQWKAQRGPQADTPPSFPPSPRSVDSLAALSSPLFAPRSSSHPAPLLC